MPDARQDRKIVPSIVFCVVAMFLGYLGGSVPRMLLLLTCWPVVIMFSVTAPPFRWIYPALCAGCILLQSPSWMVLPTILLAALAYVGLETDQRLKAPAHRALLWGSMALLCFTFYLASYASYMQTDIYQALTTLLCTRVAESPQADSVLMTLYNNGLLSVGTLLPKEQLLTDAAFTAEIREELLRCLRSYSLDIFSRMIPLIVGGLPVVSAWCCLLPASTLKRRRGETEHTLPRAETWYIPNQYSLALLGLWITALVLMNSSGVWKIAGTAIYSFLLMLFSVQGACLWVYRLKRSGIPPTTRTIIIVLLLLLIPLVLQISGVIDQVRNLRGLRGSKESEGST